SSTHNSYSFRSAPFNMAPNLSHPILPPVGRYVPSREEFRALAAQGNLVPVYREIVADADTPVSAFAKLGGAPYSFLLESVIGGEIGRASCRERGQGWAGSGTFRNQRRRGLPPWM